MSWKQAWGEKLGRSEQERAQLNSAFCLVQGVGCSDLKKSQYTRRYDK